MIIIVYMTSQESLTMLKWTATGFTMLQILVLTITTTLYLVAPGGWDILGSATTPEMRFLYIAIFILCLIATMNYLIVLFLYIRKLQKSSDTLVGDDHAKRRRNNKNSNTLRISNPLPSPLSASSSYRDHPSSNYAPLSTGTQRQSLMTPESPGIYESLDTSQQHQQLQLQLQHHHQNQIYFPSNNSSVYGSKIQNYSDGIYGPGGGGSITSRGGTRHYPYPHQRYQQPLMVREERHQQDWPVQQNASSAPVLRYNAELNRVHVYGPVRHDHHSNAAAAEPLLQQQQQQQSWPHYHHHHHHQHSQQSN